MDPFGLSALIYKNVIVETIDGRSHEGKIYTVDPVSESIVIYKKTEDGLSAAIIFKHAITGATIIQELNPTSEEEETETIVENLSELRQHLKNWLQKNLIPIEECGECLKLGAQLTITPPYAINNCLSSNEVVLNKIQMLIKRMPPYEQILKQEEN